MENKFFIKKETVKGIADAIRAKDGTTEEIAIIDMAERISAINNINYLEYCTAFNLWSLNIFEKPKVELTLPRTLILRNAFTVNKNTSDTEGRTNTTVRELIIHSPNIMTHMQSVFGQNNYYVDRTLKKIVMDFETEARTWSYCFNNLQALTHIEGTPINLSPIDGDNCTLFIFGACYELVEVRFKGIMSYSMRIEDSTKLSKDSILSLMVCLSDEATGKTITFSKIAVDTAFETSEGAMDGSTSVEWTELVVTKPNWTILLA